MLPWILISPSSVANLFNLGSVIILASFAIFHGFEEFFLRKFMVGERKFYAVGYCVALILCIYSSIFADSYILTFVCLAAEIGFMMYFVASYFPGGKEGLTKCLKAAWEMIKGCGRKGIERLN